MAWLAVIAAIATLDYAARFANTAPERPDALFRWSVAIGTIFIDTIVLVLMLLIARGLPLRDAFALRRPVSWPGAAKIAGLALLATYTTSIVIELTVGHAGREQAMPSFWDAARVTPFVANGLVIAVFVPIVEESMCRGIGFALLERWGEGIAIAGTAVAFALAHGAVTDLPWVLVTGLGLGVLRARSRSLFPCIALHGTINGVAVLAAALAGASRLGAG